MTRLAGFPSFDGPLVAEGAVVERLRRDPAVPPLDPILANAPFVLSDEGRRALTTIWDGYLDAILPSGLPALLLTPTWRASARNAEKAGIDAGRLNGEAARLVAEVRRRRGDAAGRILVGGLLGCAGDAYRPDEGLAEDEAFRFHRPQARWLAASGVDLLVASTLPSLPEAVGLARAMLSTGLPALVGFVLRPTGRLLDGTPLEEAIRLVDEATARQGSRPAGYLATCTHPDTLLAALSGDGAGTRARQRLVGIQGNGSRLPPEELDGRSEIDTTTPEEFAAACLLLREKHALRLFGGCCGTDQTHVRAVAMALANPGSRPARAPAQ